MKTTRVLIGLIEKASATLRKIDNQHELSEDVRERAKESYINDVTAPKLRTALRSGRRNPKIWIDPQSDALAFLNKKRGSRKKK